MKLDSESTIHTTHKQNVKVKRLESYEVSTDAFSKYLFTFTFNFVEALTIKKVEFIIKCENEHVKTAECILTTTKGKLSTTKYKAKHPKYSFKNLLHHLRILGWDNQNFA